MARLDPPKITGKLVPVFTSGELPAQEKVCAGRAFAQRRDTAITAAFRARVPSGSGWMAPSMRST